MILHEPQATLNTTGNPCSFTESEDTVARPAPLVPGSPSTFRDRTTKSFVRPSSLSFGKQADTAPLGSKFLCRIDTTAPTPKPAPVGMLLRGGGGCGSWR